MRTLNADLLRKALQSLRGDWISLFEKEFTGIGTDTRKDLHGQIFWALKGETYDAHDFLGQAVDAGASALVVHRETEALKEIKQKVSVFLVNDTLAALQTLARYQRLQSPAYVLGITGSNGKTTTKEFTAAIISSVKRVHYSKGSFNNHWGVPFTLLAQPQETQVSIVEMGMNHAGELTQLVEIAAPDAVVCTMVGKAHIEHFGSIEKIAEAKYEIYKASGPQVTRIFHLDDESTARMREWEMKRAPSAPVLTFSSKDSKADVHLQIESLTMGSLKIRGHIGKVPGSTEVPVFGAQNIVNLMAASALALAAGLTPEQIWQALPRCKTSWGRNQLVHTEKGAEILFDAYNANPDSMKALLDNVSLLTKSGKKIGVFGQMLEMGEHSAEAHRKLGEQVAKAGFDVVWFFGADQVSFAEGARSAGFSKKLLVSDSYKDSLASEVADVLDQNDAVLVKGSRGMKLERFVLACKPVNFSTNKE